MPALSKTPCYGLFLSLLFLLNALSISAKSCSDYTSCTMCYNSTYACHFCGDGNCHAIGSVYGCVNGALCYSNENCYRPDPVHESVEGPSASLVLGVIVFVVVVLSATFLILSLTSAFVKASEATVYRDDPSYIELGTVDEDREGGSGSRGGGKEEDEVEVLLSDHGRKSEEDFFSTPYIPQVPYLERNMRAVRAHKFTCACLGLLVSFVIVVSALVLAYAPSYPVLNVCSSEMDWNSVIEGLESLKIRSDFEMLMSIYNPNRFELKATAGSGVFLYQGKEVGSFALKEPFSAKGGYTTDLLQIVTFYPSVWDALGLESAYYDQSLVLEVEADLDIQVREHDMTFYSFSYSLDHYLIRFDGSFDRTYCGCSYK